MPHSSIGSKFALDQNFLDMGQRAKFCIEKFFLVKPKLFGQNLFWTHKELGHFNMVVVSYQIFIL